MSSMEEPGHLPPLSEALSTPEPSLLLTEAKRQYDALVQALDGSKSSTPIVKVTDLNGTLWRRATADLEPTWKIYLQIICFAYKTKLKVMHYFDLLGDKHAWAQPLLQFVRERGRDSAFDVSSVTGELEACPELRLFIEAQQRERRITTTRSTSTLLNAKPILIIPTLPLALPVAFFDSLGAHGPLKDLYDTQKLLSHPAALLLALDNTLKSNIQKHFLATLSSPTQDPENGTINNDDDNHNNNNNKTNNEKEWTPLFTHLSHETHPLLSNEHIPIEHDDADGYGATDLSIWCAGWLGERGKKGTSEEGRRIRESGVAGKKRGRRASSSSSSSSHEAGAVGAVGSQRRRRVGSMKGRLPRRLA